MGQQASDMMTQYQQAMAKPDVPGGRWGGAPPPADMAQGPGGQWQVMGPPGGPPPAWDPQHMKPMQRPDLRPPTATGEHGSGLGLGLNLSQQRQRAFQAAAQQGQGAEWLGEHKGVAQKVNKMDPTGARAGRLQEFIGTGKRQRW